eukprot:c35267_g1_i1.p1 GENE.c35267_g1_i1~~c35267_g1_i1.p1  ORF type:complete len:174 (-),score=44.99 c35267_g1_i1:165-686(-)
MELYKRSGVSKFRCAPNSHTEYLVDVENNIQTNLETGFVRVLRFTPSNAVNTAKDFQFEMDNVTKFIAFAQYICWGKPDYEQNVLKQVREGYQLASDEEALKLLKMGARIHGATPAQLLDLLLDEEYCSTDATFVDDFFNTHETFVTDLVCSLRFGLFFVDRLSRVSQVSPLT